MAALRVMHFILQINNTFTCFRRGKLLEWFCLAPSTNIFSIPCVCSSVSTLLKLISHQQNDKVQGSTGVLVLFELAVSILLDVWR